MADADFTKRALMQRLAVTIDELISLVDSFPIRDQYDSGYPAPFCSNEAYDRFCQLDEEVKALCDSLGWTIPLDGADEKGQGFTKLRLYRQRCKGDWTPEGWWFRSATSGNWHQRMRALRRRVEIELEASEQIGQQLSGQGGDNRSTTAVRRRPGESESAHNSLPNTQVSSEESDDREKERRACYDRDHLFWKKRNKEGLMPLKIRDWWNGLSDQERYELSQRCPRKVTVETVRTGIKTARKERA